MYVFSIFQEIIQGNDGHNGSWKSRKPCGEMKSVTNDTVGNETSESINQIPIN